MTLKIRKKGLKMMAVIRKRVNLSEDVNEKVNQLAEERDIYPSKLINDILEDYFEAERNRLDDFTTRRLNQMQLAIEQLAYVHETQFNTLNNKINTISNLATSDNYLLDGDSHEL